MSTNTPIDPFYVQVDDELEEMQPQLKRALEFTDEEFARLSDEYSGIGTTLSRNSTPNPHCWRCACW